MSPLLRGSLVAAVLAVSFAAGYVLKPVPVIPSAVAQAPAPSPPPADVPLILPPMDEVKPAAPDVDPNDPTLRMIRDSLGIKTTVLDKNEPLPAVLTDAVKDPVPMGGPMPRLEPPPAPVLPMINPSPVRRPEPAPGPSVRITIRDAGGHVTTLTTTGRVTIDLIGPDGTMPEPGPMPHVVGEPVSAIWHVGRGRPDNIEVCYELLGGLRLDEDRQPVCALTGVRVALRDLSLEDMVTWGPPGKLMIWKDRLRGCAETFAGFSQGRTVLSLLADPDWKPTTATPDSCRWEPSPPAAGPAVDGASDIVIPTGQPPASTVARSAFESP